MEQILPFNALIGLPLDATLTIRMASIERVRLDGLATQQKMSTSAYARMQLADENVQHKLAHIQSLQQQRSEYAHILRILGQSRIANNLNQIAHQLNMGTFLFTPDVVVQINEAYEAILYIRSLLIQSMGVKVQ